MPVRDDLLQPIAGENPSGPSLRYDRVFDQIKEARTEEDDTLPSGAWARTVKRADFRLVLKLAGDALATRSKDLQLAVWLGEALLRQEGVAALAPTLRLLLDLQGGFWETLHPEIDEGDAGMRAAPLQWAAKRYAGLANEIALTRKGVGLIEYKAARALGTEAEAGSNDAKRKAREEAVAAGRLTSEEVDEAISGTPKSFYVTLASALGESLAVLGELDLFCEERYGDDAPSFRALRQVLEELENLAGSLLREKRLLEPDPVAVPEPEDTPAPVEDAAPALPARVDAAAEPQTATPTPAAAEAPAAAFAAATAAPTTTPPFEAEPRDWDEAQRRVDSLAAWMAATRPEDPSAFLLRHALRSAELQLLVEAGTLHLLPAPPTALRQALKRASAEGAWAELHAGALAAFGTASGTGWVDLYRYLWTSCRELGWFAQAGAIAQALEQQLRAVPTLPEQALDDDTLAANSETLRWIAEEIAPPASASLPCPTCAQRDEEARQPKALAVSVEGEPSAQAEQAPADQVYLQARALAARGEVQAAIQLLARDAAQQPVGRLRYGRNLQIAELCLESGNSAVAVPVLQGLVREVEERRLESWEPPESAARPYALLLQCAAVARLDAPAIFARLCAIDPGAALTLAPSVEG